MNNIVSKQDRFKRVASKRVVKLISTIRSLANCANTNNYYYEEEDINKMMKAIKEEIKILELEYKKRLLKKSDKFNF